MLHTLVVAVILSAVLVWDLCAMAGDFKRVSEDGYSEGMRYLHSQEKTKWSPGRESSTSSFMALTWNE